VLFTSRRSEEFNSATSGLRGAGYEKWKRGERDPERGRRGFANKGLIDSVVEELLAVDKQSESQLVERSWR